MGNMGSLPANTKKKETIIDHQALAGVVNDTDIIYDVEEHEESAENRQELDFDDGSRI